MSSPELVDTHCHLDYEYDGKTAGDLVRDAGLAGVTKLVTIATETSRIGAVQKISDAHAGVYHAVGVHPHEADAMTDEDLVLLEKAAAHPKCVAIGEIGIDYHYNHSSKDSQILRLEQQLELALKVGKPVVIHSREGEDDALKALTAYAKRARAGRPPGVIHCFTGTRGFGQSCLDLGFMISFSGIMTFKNAEDLRDAARAYPLDRVLVETDSPYLAPVPMRGKKCEPAMVAHTARKLAEVKGVSFEDLARATTANAARLFGF